MKINTNKTMFFGSRTFTSKSITKEEFQTKLYDKYELLNNIYKDSDIECTSDSSILDLICTIADYLENNSYKHFEKLKADFNIAGMGFDMMNWGDYKGQLEFKTLDNGFSYIGIYSSVGDDATAPIYNIFYFDEMNDLRAYCPYCGNLVFVGANTQMCVYGGYGDEENATEQLFKEYCERFEDNCDDYESLFIKLYSKKYGSIGEIDDACFDDLEFDVNLMEADIKSNVILC